MIEHCLVELSSSDRLGYWRKYFFAIRNCWVAFAVGFGYVSICTVRRRVWTDVSSCHFYQQTSHQEILVTQFHWNNAPSTIFDRWCCMLLSLRILFSTLWCRLTLVYSCKVLSGFPVLECNQLCISIVKFVFWLLPWQWLLHLFPLFFTWLDVVKLFLSTKEILSSCTLVVFF